VTATPGETFGHRHAYPAGRAVSVSHRFFARLALVHSMLLTFALFLGSAVVIYLACEYFVNGVEWFGRKLKLSSTATGTVLAAFGTALPESAVTFVAVIFGKTPEARDIGVGAALGGPLVLATIAYAVVGGALWLNRRRLKRADRLIRVDHQRLARDQSWFLAIFVVKVGLGLVAFAIKPWLGIVFLAAYGLYVWREMRSEDHVPEDEELDPLKFRPRQVDPAMRWVVAQTVIALAVIAAASRLFVGQLEAIGAFFSLPAHFVALVLSPVATELPETVNALIWVRQGKERLALANISGAMMIQATIPSSLALFATPWLFDAPLKAAGVITMIAIGYLWWLFQRGRVDARWILPVGLLYGVFAVFAGWWLAQG
jgi:cation:H+ antiporter